MRRLAWIVVGIGLVGAGGCQRPAVSLPPFGMTNDFRVLSGQPGPGLVLAETSPIPDVPLPIGFRPLPELCSASVEGADGARRVRHVYQGMGNAGEVVAFYRQHLPSRGWQLAGIRGGNEADAVLSYSKGPEQLEARIRGGGVSTITLDIYPTGSSPAPMTAEERRG